MKQELTTNSRPLTHSEHSMDYILKKSETIKSLFEDFETCLDNFGSKYPFLVGNLLNIIMRLVEDIDRCVCAMNSVDMSMHRMYVLLSLYHYREKLNELYRGVHGRYQETQFYIQSCIDDKDKSDFYCRCNKYWQERLQYVPDADAIKKKLDILTIEKRLDSFDRHAMMVTDSIYTAITTALMYEINHTNEIFDKYKQDSITATVECAKAYCRTFWDIEEDRLIKQANRDRYKRVLDEDDWCGLRHTEEKIIDYIIGESTDYDYGKILTDYYDDCICENRELIEQFKECLPYDKLFNIKEAFEKNHKLAVSLKYDNIYLFYRMVLRFNILQCHIYPELKPELDAWMNGVEYVNDIKNKEQEATAVVEKSEDWLKKNNKVFIVGRKKKLYTFQLLYEFIYDNFVQSCANAYEWFALLKFLKDEGYCNRKCDVSKFIAQMSEWFDGAPQKSALTETNRYSFLNGHDVEKWVELDERYFDSKGKKNKKAIGNIHQVYTRLKKKHDDL